MTAQIDHLVSTRDLDLEMVQSLFSRTEKLKRLRGVLPVQERALRGESVGLLFWEPSTRTRVSFELAAQRVGARVVHLHPKDSSVAKGENLTDTLANLRALGCRFFVIRHGTSGEVARLAEKSGRGGHVISAGDGANEHPSQALLDAFTIRERKRNLEEVQVAILGDILRSRVARSNLYLLGRLGVRCRVAGPPELMPKNLDMPQVTISKSADEAVRDADVVMALRLQREREGTHFTLPDADYLEKFGVTAKRMQLAKPDALVMHPGPMNRGVEIESEVADGPASVILRQVENGLFLRMALFEALRGDAG